MEKRRFIFDLDGTLIDTDWAQGREYFRRVLSSEDSNKLISQIPVLLGEYEKIHSRYTIDELSHFMTLRTGICISPRMINGWLDTLTSTDFKVIDGVYETLEYLKFCDKSLVILTNWFLEGQEAKLKKAHLDGYFDFVCGGELGIKPTRESYFMASGEYPIENCVIIGDSLDTDVYGASMIGLDSVFYNPKNRDDFDKNKVKSIGSIKKIKEMF